MKFFKYLALLTATAAFLAACGTSDENGDGGSTTSGGTLIVNVQDSVTGAAVTGDITVTQDGTTVDTAEGVSTKTWTGLAAGAYSVSVDNAEGYLASGAQTVNVTDGDTTRYNAQMVSDDQLTQDVASVEFAFEDDLGMAYATVAEKNENKDATLIAAQTEEDVGVTVTVLDENGDPVAYAPVTVNVTASAGDDVAIFSGKPSNASTMATTFEGLVTNEDGEAYFTVQGTSEQLTNPAKFIVSALGADEVNETAEFKTFFLNISHLQYAVPSPNDWEFNGSVPEGTPDSASDITITGTDGRAVPSDQRMGATLPGEVNAFDDDESFKNFHYFTTLVDEKQPQETLDVIVGEDDNGLAPGYVEYVLSDVSTDADGNALVEWAYPDALCQDGSTATSCTDAATAAGVGVGLKPVDSVELADLPIEATVTATYFAEVTYGGETYEFALKDYTVTKTWTGGFLGIDKYVDQHVLTWKGPEVTLATHNDGTFGSDDENYYATVNIIVTNPSNGSLYDVFVRDGVPPELGVVTSSISNGGTYDEDNHAVTWNESTVAALEELEPGADPVVLTFDVYARHKPGYCWAGSDDLSTYVVENLDSTVLSGSDVTEYDEHCYADPYKVTNGDTGRSVIASGWPVENYDINTDQVSFSYDPQDDESDINVVRPLINLTKTRLTEPVMFDGEVVKFELDATSVDRTATGNAYEDLADQYPWEFNGALTAGTGHVSDGSEVPGSTDDTASETRNNPYLEGVDVDDLFAVGLDFSKAEDFDGNLITSEDDDRIQGKTLDFTAFDLEPGQTKDAEVWLTGNLVSTGISGSQIVSQNNAYVTVTDTDGVVSGVDEAVFAWNNCAYLGADQLNQPSTTDAEYDNTIYNVSTSDASPVAENYWHKEPWTVNYDPSLPYELSSATDAVSITSVSPTYVKFSEADGRLEACDTVAVVDAPDLGINVRGEFFVSVTDNLITSDTDILSGTNVSSTDLVSRTDVGTDVMAVGEDFVYFFSIETSGTLEIENAVFDIGLTDDHVDFVGKPWAVYTDDGGTTWHSASSLFNELPAANVAQSYTLTAPTLQPGLDIRIAISAEAKTAGTQDTTFEATYDNNVTQDLPLTSDDSTTVEE